MCVYIYTFKVLHIFLFLSHLCPGVKNADEAELRQVASEPLELNVYNVNDFPLLSKLVGRLARILCGKIEDRIKAKSRSICLRYIDPTNFFCVLPLK